VGIGEILNKKWSKITRTAFEEWAAQFFAMTAPKPGSATQESRTGL
jgi:hypothetical protein